MYDFFVPIITTYFFLKQTLYHIGDVDNAYKLMSTAASYLGLREPEDPNFSFFRTLWLVIRFFWCWIFQTHHIRLYLNVIFLIFIKIRQLKQIRYTDNKSLESFLNFTQFLLYVFSTRNKLQYCNVNFLILFSGCIGASALEESYLFGELFRMDKDQGRIKSKFAHAVKQFSTITSGKAHVHQVTKTNLFPILTVLLMV